MSLTLVAAMLSGCHCGALIKRESECACPTDIRQTVPWCAGEDAIFKCPCRPAYEFYGYKPTCWGVWPTSAAEWRDSYCCPVVADYPSESIIQGPEVVTPLGSGENYKDFDRGYTPSEPIEPRSNAREAIPTPAPVVEPPANRGSFIEPDYGTSLPPYGAVRANPFLK